MHDNFIQLNRHFARLSEDQELGEDYDARVAFGVTKPLLWKDVLQKHRTVILAEPGAGKTWEIKQAALGLKEQGKSAFFLRLEHISDNLEIAFDIGTFEEFQEWLTGETDGWFFLDSVDEARLTNPKQFDAAIRKFAQALQGQGQRAHIFVTSRIVEWRPKSDVRLLKEKLTFEKPAIQTENQPDDDEEFEIGEISTDTTQSKLESTDTELDILALVPLTTEQMQQFAEARGLSDADDMVQEIIRSDAKMFASRPQDLEELISFWKEHHRIGGRRELIQAGIATKLREYDPDRRDPLPEDKAREGAELLAAATTLQHTSRICIPDREGTAKGIIAAELLSDWSEPEIRALLNRPIFDEAIYGTVRFHHRVVREYLCACWLLKLIQDGKSRRAVEKLIFRKQYGMEVVVPTMKPILPWVALEDNHIRARSLKVAPELLIDGGDPSQLPLEIKQSLLREFCEQYAEKTLGHFYFDQPSIKRFSHPDLATSVNELLDRFARKQEIASLLLPMITQGKMLDCWQRVKTIALDKKQDSHHRVMAIRAAAAIATKEQIDKLLIPLLETLTAKDHFVLAEMIDSFAPEFMTFEMIDGALRKLQSPARFEYRPLEHSLEEYIKRCSQRDVLLLVQKFLVRLKEPPSIDRQYCEVSEVNKWLLPFSAQACERLILDRHVDALHPDVIATISMCAVVPHFDSYRSDKHKLRELVPAWPALNHLLFWHDVAMARKELDKKKGERLTHWWNARTFRDYCKFEEGDFKSIAADITNKSLLDDQLVALSLAFQLYMENGRPRKWREQLKDLVSGKPDLEAAMRSHLHPPPQSEETKKWKRQEAGFRRRQKQREKKQAEIRADWRVGIAKNVRILRDTSVAKKRTVWNDSLYLLNRLRDVRENQSQWAQSNWRDLIPEFGNEVATAFRDGAVAYWRAYKPAIRSEGVDNPNSIPHCIILGLTGLAIEAREDPQWMEKLTVEEAKLAARYALWEMNGFPRWLRDLHQQFPNIVEASLLTEIRWEILLASDTHDGHYVIADLLPYGEWIKETIAPAILEAMKTSCLQNDQLFHHCLQVIHSSASISNDQLLSIAKNSSLDKKTPDRQPIWWATWLSIDPEPAVLALEQHLKEIADPKDATEFAMKFAVALLGERRHSLKNNRDNYRTAPMLHRLHDLLQKYIRPSDDINRSGGGCYTPALRDDAQEARNRIFGLLKEIPGKETFLALLTIADAAAHERPRQWMEHQAKNRAEIDADIAPWCTNDTRDFSNEYEWKPSNHQQLFGLVVSRLLDLKSDLEDGDSSIASLLLKSKDETEYRKYIGAWLRDCSRTRYVVPQEEELADAKRPDIRILCTGFDGPVPIELKIANNWSGTQLFERLENQLCGDYLRDDRSNCGIYLLLYRGDKMWDHPKTSERISFPVLLKALQAHADQYIRHQSGINRVEVIGIDLTARCSRRSLSKQR